MLSFTFFTSDYTSNEGWISDCLDSYTFKYIYYICLSVINIDESVKEDPNHVNE
jgi:hypothetical protein